MYAPRRHLQFSPHTSRSHAASHTNYTPLTFRPRPAPQQADGRCGFCSGPYPIAPCTRSSDTGRRHCSPRSSGYNNYGWVSPFGHPDTDGANPRRRPESGGSEWKPRVPSACTEPSLVCWRHVSYWARQARWTWSRNPHLESQFRKLRREKEDRQQSAFVVLFQYFVQYFHFRLFFISFSSGILTRNPYYHMNALAANQLGLRTRIRYDTNRTFLF